MRSYRDLGIAGDRRLARAHVIRFIPAVPRRGRLDPAFSRCRTPAHLRVEGLVQVSEFEGHGPITMRQGSSWVQPPRIKHAVLDYSDDCESLEVILPADFETVELDKTAE